MTKLLLINPRGPDSFWEMRWFIDYLLPGKSHVSPPVGLATIAALTPDDWEIEIIDEYVDEVPMETDADIVGVGGTCLQYPRQRELIQHFNRQGKYTVAGGPYVSLVPSDYACLADTRVVGEAEYTWPRFCADWPRPQSEYVEFGDVALTDSPTPRFDLLKLDQYLYSTVQFSRGCPFRCEFCDAIVIYGRKPRTKDNDQIIAELDQAYARGVRSVFFAEDNLIGNKKVAKALFRRLIEWRAGFDEPMKFGTEVTLNIAYDDEMLALMREAGFDWVFIGLETPNNDTLIDVKKNQNTKADMIESVYKIYRAGVHIYAGFILGFDEDTTESFEAMRDFVQASGVQVAQISPLIAFQRTPLYDRLKKDGRLLSEDITMDIAIGDTNIIPKQMTRDELRRGHRWVYEQLYTYEAIAERVAIKAREMGTAGMEYNDYGNFGTARKLKRSIPEQYRDMPKELRPMMLKEWSMGLMIKDYVEANLSGSDSLRTVHV